MNAYAVVNESGLVLNIIVWDGVSPYDPGEGLSLVPAVLPVSTIEGGGSFTEIGGTYEDGVFTRAPR